MLAIAGFLHDHPSRRDRFIVQAEDDAFDRARNVARICGRCDEAQ
jgi:hypothetical protein